MDPQLNLLEKKIKNNKRKSPEGYTTSNLVFSSYEGDNSEIFPHILKLHVKKGQTKMSC